MFETHNNNKEIILKKLLIALSIVALSSTASFSATCVKPKYISHGEKTNDFGAKIVSAAFLPFTTALGVTLEVLGTGAEAAGAKKFASGTKNALCASRAQWKHISGE